LRHSDAAGNDNIMEYNITPLEEWIRTKIAPEETALTREAIDRWQLSAFRRMFDYVKEKSPFYRQLLDCFSSKDMDGLAWIGGLPFTAEEDVRSRGAEMVCVRQNEISRIVTLDTSGTTGQPKRIYFTEADQELTIDFFHHGMSTFTIPGDRVLVLLPGPTPGSIGDLLQKGLARLGAEAVVYGIADDAEKVLGIICSQKITGIVGIPQQLCALARVDNGRVRETSHLRNVLLSADYVSPAVGETIRNAWNCRVYEHYGMTETGLGGGVFCKAETGYHMREADLLYEIVDPDNGRPLPDGEVGEIVFSTLTRAGMPLIRYRTGDIGRFLTGRCPCGTVLKTMERVRRRRRDEARLSDGSVLAMPMLEDILFNVEGIMDFDARIEDLPEAESKGRERIVIGINAGGDAGDVRKRVIQAMEASTLGGRIRSGMVEIIIENQPAKEPDIKAIRKRSLTDARIKEEER